MVIGMPGGAAGFAPRHGLHGLKNALKLGRWLAGLGRKKPAQTGSVKPFWLKTAIFRFGHAFGGLEVFFPNPAGVANQAGARVGVGVAARACFEARVGRRLAIGGLVLGLGWRFMAFSLLWRGAMKCRWLQVCGMARVGRTQALSVRLSVYCKAMATQWPSMGKPVSSMSI